MGVCPALPLSSKQYYYKAAMTVNQPSCLIQERYLSDEFAQQFYASFTLGTDFYDKDTGCSLVHHPFTVATLPNFLAGEQKQLGAQFASLFSELSFKHKLNDLHDFFQSPDLVKSPVGAFTKSLQRFIPAMVDVLHQWKDSLSKMTGIKLNDTIDAACQIYKKNGRLLCHDDALEGRRIAYILYLIDDAEWTEKEGGALELFTTDKNGHPLNVARKIYPKRNMLAFFEVTPISYHQVGEVLTKKNRRSMTGWFHGLCPQYKMTDFLKHIDQHQEPIYLNSQRLLCQQPSLQGSELAIHPQYQQAKVKKIMAATLNREAIIELKQFIVSPPDPVFIPSEWAACGPPNYCRISEWMGSHSAALASLLYFFTCTTMKQYICALAHVPSAQLKCASIWHVSHGDYLLVHDQFAQNAHYRGVDTYYYLFSSQLWEPQWGGSVQYCIADGDVISIPPCENSLFVLSKSENSQRTMNFVNSKSVGSFFCCHVGWATTSS